MDGLLLDSERVAMMAFRELAVEAGLCAAQADADFLGLIGSSATQTRHRLHDILPEGTDVSEFSARWSERFAQLTQSGVPLRPYVAEVITMLSHAGHAMAVVTSTQGGHARAQLAQVGLLEHFACVVGGDEVRANKPDPEPYLAGARRLGVEARDCVAFEDSDTGVRSAVAAGCRVVQVPDLRPSGLALPELGQSIARDLREAARLILNDAVTSD